MISLGYESYEWAAQRSLTASSKCERTSELVSRLDSGGGEIGHFGVPIAWRKPLSRPGGRKNRRLFLEALNSLPTRDR